MNQLAPRDVFKVAPQHVGAAHQRHVRAVFKVRQADNTGRPVRRAAIVPKRELFDAGDADAAARQLIECRAARRAEADDGDVRS